ncbi:MAG: sulfite exporter TauE/SafE family protein [Clostridia bacterium]|nr:sulfite exporter TauE/SafE family protein [Clostridia bacterium]
MNYLISIVAGFLSGLVGSMGFGGGGILIIYLVIFAKTPQVVAQGINLIFFIPCAILATIIYATKKQIKNKEILPVILGGFLGAIISGFFLKNIESHVLTKVFAFSLIYMGVISLFKIIKDKNKS